MPGLSPSASTISPRPRTTRLYAICARNSMALRHCFPTPTSNSSTKLAHLKFPEIRRSDLRVDPSEKLEAVEAVLPLGLRRGRFKAPDALIASLFEPG